MNCKIRRFKALSFACGILILLSMQSCLTVARIQRNCDAFSKICTVATVTDIKYRDTTIYIDRKVPVFLSRDTAKIYGLVGISTLGAQMAAMTSTSGLVTVKSSIENSKLVTVGYINKDSIVAAIRDSVILKNAIRDTNSKNTIVVRDKSVSAIYKYSLWIVIIEIVALILLVISKLTAVTPMSIISKITGK